MSLHFEMDRLLTELARDKPDTVMTGKRPAWLESGVTPFGGTHVAALTDEAIQSWRSVLREAEVRDAKVEFLAVRLRPGRQPTFRFIERTASGSIRRRVTIGSASDYTPDEARVQALRMEIANRDLGRLPTRHRLPRDILVTQAWERYEEACIPHSGRRRTARLVEPYLRNFGERRVSESRRALLLNHIERLSLQDQTHGHEVHKRLRAFLGWCVRGGALDGNPLSRVPMPERVAGPRKTLSLEQLGKIYKSTSDLDAPWRCLVGFIMLTGASVDQARRLRRADIDLAQGVWSTDGRRGPSRCLVSDAVIDLLANQSAASHFYFQTRRGQRHSTPAHLRPSILSSLQRLSGVQAWSWRDLTQNVRHEMRSCSVRQVSAGHAAVDLKASSEAWANKLTWASTEEAFDRMHGVVL